MADKTLKTRIKLRYDTWENWNSATNKTKTLLEGEVAIVAINTGTINPQTGFPTTAPTVLFKVGAKKDASSLYTFDELPWASGMAADVYDWAKQAHPGDAITIEESGQGSFVSHIEWDATKNKLIIDKDDITIPGGSGEVTTTATQVVGSVKLENHSLTGTPKTINGDTNSGIVVSGDANNIKISGPVHTVSEGATASYTYQISQDASTKGLTFQKGELGLYRYSDYTALSTHAGDIIFYTADGFVIGATSTGGQLLLTKKDIRPQYVSYGMDQPQSLALLSDIEEAVSGAVQYWGVANKIEDLGKDMTAPDYPTIKVGKGDFYRIGKDFIMDSTQLHAGDLLIAETDNPGPTIDDAGYARIIQEDYKGTVTSVTAGNGLSGGTITSSGTISHEIPANASAGDHDGGSRDAICTGLQTDKFGHVTDTYFGQATILNTNNSSVLAVSSNESLSPDITINLHKISKTGSYNDLNDKPTIPTVNDGTLTINNGTGIEGGPVVFTANQAGATTKSLSVTNWSTSLYYQTNDLKLRDNSENFIVLDGGAAGTWN